jgi:stage II sporulation protein M
MGYRWWVVAAVSLFAIGLLAGLFTPSNTLLLNELVDRLKELSGNITPFSLSTVFFIFAKNAISVALGFVFAPLLLLAPLFTLLLNSWLLGFISAAAVHKESLSYALAGLLPHGILEIPAIVIGEAAAFYFGSVLILALFIPERRPVLGTQVWRSVKFLLLTFILLIPAAFIETFITPRLIGM